MMRLFRLTRFAIPFLVFLLLILFFWKGLGTDPRQVPSALINQPVPVFALPALQDPALNLNQQLFVGHISVLHVWATWCGTCKSEHPFWVDRAKNHQVALYGLIYKDARFSAQAWLKQHGNPYAQIINDESGRLAMDLGVSGTPETFLIDAKGVVRYKVSGPVDQRLWAQEFLPRIKMLEQRS
jgi:cytochrome c biogenesis protein CcmG/thiol:disulfide interchange protein DsbE